MAYVVPSVFFDPPLVIDCTITPIPGSGSLPLQVVHDTGTVTAVALVFSDNTGDLIGVYIGGAGQEQLVCVAGNGVTGQAWGEFPRHSRVSLRSMTTDAITNGKFFGGLGTL